jgi:predicted short-subunit dehydrogenase-like oxidoreductase (DUF2520 family)
MELRYLIVGSGRLSKHLQKYFSQLGLSFQVWHRSLGTHIETSLESSDVVCLAIADSAIENFASSHPQLLLKKLVHFSGAKFISNIQGAHPLSAFSNDLYELSTYRKIPFVLDSFDGINPHLHSFDSLFPKLENPNFTIRGDLKPSYHARCVLLGNFTTLLWEEIGAKFSSSVNLPPSVLLEFLNQTFVNLSGAIEQFEKTKQLNSVLTGPLVRNDKSTIDLHLKTLAGTPEFILYQSFINYFSATRLPTVPAANPFDNTCMERSPL